MQFQRVYVVIPALDEESSLPLVLADLSALPLPLAEVVVVDNGSRDGTALVAGRAGATVLREEQRGYGAACLRAIAHVADREPSRTSHEVVVAFLDADYSDYPEDLEALLHPIREGRAQFVLGSRLLDRSARAAVPLPSRVGNRLAAFAIRTLYGVRFTDLGPFRAIALPALLDLEMRDRTWGWTLEMQLRACQRRLAIVEIPVRYRPRHGGRSKISGSLWGGVRAAARILWVFGRHLVATTPWMSRGPVSSRP